MTKRKRLLVSDVVRISLSSAVAKLDASEPALWAENDPEAVHQARVATRRLRSDLRTLHEFVDARWSSRLRGELRWLGAELGAVRDSEVLRLRLSAHAALLPAAEAEAARAAINRLGTNYAAARAELLLALRDARYAQLHRALHDAVTNPRVTDAAATRAVDAIPGAVRPAWRRLRRAVRELGSVPSDTALHEVRIRAKRCRYAADTAAIVFGSPAREFGAAVARVQDVLGEHQDAVVATAWIAKTAPECSAPEAYALGMLAEIERGLAVVARGGLDRAWETARAPRLRSWL